MKCVRDSLPIMALNISMFQPVFITNILSNIVETMDKEELYKYIREKVEKESGILDLKARQTFLQKGSENFCEWLGYRSTHYTLCKHVTKVYGKNISILFQLSSEIKDKSSL